MAVGVPQPRDVDDAIVESQRDDGIGRRVNIVRRHRDSVFIVSQVIGHAACRCRNHR